MERQKGRPRIRFIKICKECSKEFDVIKFRKKTARRKHWITFFQNLLSERYGYKYENQLPVIELEILKWKRRIN